jgi:hypothetical protein
LKNLGVKVRKSNSNKNVITDNSNVSNLLINNNNTANLQNLSNTIKGENLELPQSPQKPISIGNKRKKRDEESLTEGNVSSRGKKRKKNEINIPTGGNIIPIPLPVGNISRISPSNLIQFEVHNSNLPKENEIHVQEPLTEGSPLQKENLIKENSSLQVINNNMLTAQQNFLKTNLNTSNNNSASNLYNNFLSQQNTTQVLAASKDIFSVDDSLSIANSKATEGNLISFFPSSRGRKENNLMLMNTMNNFNDEAFESIIKEFLNINDFPTDPKEKVTILKRFIPLYKKIKGDKSKLLNFIKKISDKLSESLEEINVRFFI